MSEGSRPNASASSLATIPQPLNSPSSLPVPFLSQETSMFRQPLLSLSARRKSSITSARQSLLQVLSALLLARQSSGILTPSPELSKSPLLLPSPSTISPLPLPLSSEPAPPTSVPSTESAQPSLLFWQQEQQILELSMTSRERLQQQLPPQSKPLRAVSSRRRASGSSRASTASAPRFSCAEACR